MPDGGGTPRSGPRRRHLVRDRMTAALRRRARGLERQIRYEAGEVAGIAHKLTDSEHTPAQLDDVSLVRKVESELFRDRTIPKGAISINADDAILVLRGQLDDAQDIQRIERLGRWMPARASRVGSYPRARARSSTCRGSAEAGKQITSSAPA